MTNYSPGWQMPTADDVSDVEIDRWRYIVANDVTAEVPHADGVRSGKPSTMLDVTAVAAHDIRRPLLSRETTSDGVYSFDPVTGALTLVSAPAVRYTPESGRPTGWSEQAPETSPVVLARSRSRVTRSRKGRTSFVVSRRNRHMVTVGDRDAAGCDWSVPPGRWSGAQLANMAEAFVRAHAWQHGADVEPLPRLIGADDGRQMSKPLNVDRSNVADVTPSDVEVAHIRRRWTFCVERAADVVVDGERLPGRIIWTGWRRAPIRPDDVTTAPYLLATSRSVLDAPGVAQNRGVVTDDASIADAWPMLRRLARRAPRRIVAATTVLSDSTDERGRRRIVRGTVAADGCQELLAPGIGGWWVGHRFVADGRTVARSKAADKARTVTLAGIRATVDGWLPVAVALDVGQVATVDGVTFKRPTVQRFTVTLADGSEHGGRTAAAAIVKARRQLARR